MVQHKVVPSIILPNPNVTRIDIAANWIYDLQAPAPGEHMQENQAGVENVVPEMNQQGPQQEQEGNDPHPATIEAIHASFLLQDQRQQELMQMMQELQHDQHDNAYWNHRDISNLTDEMWHLSFRVEGCMLMFTTLVRNLRDP